jgi:hypothetical protein
MRHSLGCGLERATGEGYHGQGVDEEDLLGGYTIATQRPLRFWSLGEPSSNSLATKALEITQQRVGNHYYYNWDTVWVYTIGVKNKVQYNAFEVTLASQRGQYHMKTMNL